MYIKYEENEIINFLLFVLFILTLIYYSHILILNIYMLPLVIVCIKPVDTYMLSYC